MTYQDLVDEIVRLPVQQRLTLLELVSRSLREDLRPSIPPQSLGARLRGIGRPDGPMPVDAEIEDDYTRYLERKYA